MPEMSKKYIPEHMHDKNPNPKLLKFVRRVTDRFDGKLKGIKVEDPEYWGFACIFEDEMTETERENSLDQEEISVCRYAFNVCKARNGSESRRLSYGQTLRSRNDGI